MYIHRFDSSERCNCFIVLKMISTQFIRPTRRAT